MQANFSSLLLINIYYFYLVTEAATKGLLFKIGVLTMFAKSLKKSLKSVKGLINSKVTDCGP